MPESPPPLRKYPRTRHFEGSRLQPGDEDLDSVPFTELSGRCLVVEEKVDGANAAISFDAIGQLWLQSRGHYLMGGPREKHFSLFKQWANHHAPAIHRRLGNRYVIYGEWTYARHTIYYNRLPHYFLEFDVLDRQEDCFLSTEQRGRLLSGLPIVSVPVVHQGTLADPASMADFITRSAFIEPEHLAELREACLNRGLEPGRALAETDPETSMEGLYVKVEEADCVTARYKFIRPSFLTAVLDSGTHWLNRPIVPNRLADGVNLY